MWGKIKLYMSKITKEHVKYTCYILVLLLLLEMQLKSLPVKLPMTITFILLLIIMGVYYYMDARDMNK